MGIYGKEVVVDLFGGVREVCARLIIRKKYGLIDLNISAWFLAQFNS